jgi:hypothetical protein
LSFLDFQRKTTADVVIGIEPIGAIRVGYDIAHTHLYVRIAGDFQAFFVAGTSLEIGLKL